MVNQQLVEYVKQQIQGGVSSEEIKKALLDAGWPESDVSDSISSAAGATSASAPATEPVATADTRSINPLAAMGAGNSSGPAIGGFTTGTTGTTAADKKYFDDSSAPIEKGNGGKIAMIVMGGVIVALLVALGYIYFTLNGKLETASTATPSGSTAQSTELQQQVDKLTTDNGTLTGQLNALTADNQDLLKEVGLFAPSTTSSTDVSVKGTLSQSATVYSVTTKHGIKVPVRNSKDAKVDAALKSLVNQNVELSGTRRAGQVEITVVAVNGTPLSAMENTATSSPAGASTSTSTSSPTVP